MAATTIPGLAIKVDADTSGVEKTLQGLSGKMNSLLGAGTSAAISSGITASLMVADKAFQVMTAGVNAASTAFNQFMATAGRLGDLKDLSSKLEIDPNDLLSIKRGARLSGANEEGVANLVGTLQNTLGEAMSGGKNPFDAIGLSVSQLAVLDPVGQIGAIGDKLREITDPALREKLGEDIFGKQFRQMSPLITAGAEGLAQWRQEFEQMGMVLDESVVSNFDRVDDKVKDVYGQLQASSDKLLGGIAPAIESIADLTSQWLEEFNNGSMDRWVARFTALSQAFSLGLTLATDKIRGLVDYVISLIKKLENIPGMKGLTDGLTGGGLADVLGVMSPMDFMNSIEENAIGIEKKMKADREASISERAQKKEADMARRAQGQLGRIFGGLGQDAMSIGSGIAGMFGGGDLSKTLKPGQPQFAGAMEQGSAAAYAAAYQQGGQNKTEEKIEKNTEKTNTLLKSGFDGLKAVIPKFKFATA